MPVDAQVLIVAHICGHEKNVSVAACSVSEAEQTALVLPEGLKYFMQMERKKVAVKEKSDIACRDLLDGLGKAVPLPPDYQVQGTPSIVNHEWIGDGWVDVGDGSGFGFAFPLLQLVPIPFGAPEYQPIKTSLGLGDEKLDVEYLAVVQRKS